jgi:pimeloyl-ACP methyl ester carboxylesterase
MQPVFHQEIGKGHPLILIHGFCETHRIWDRLAEHLSSTFRVILPDLPGFGKSPLPPIPFSITDVSLTMLEWIEGLQIDSPIVIGHSLGGYVVLAMMEKQPQWFPGFGLFHSTAYADPVEKRENRNKVIDFVSRNGVDPFIDTFVPNLFHQQDNPSIGEVHKIASQTSPKTLIAYATAMRDRPARDHVLETFPKPVLMIAGERDKIIPYGDILAQSRRMKFPFFLGLEETGHMGMYENEPAALKAVKEFVNLALQFQS